MQPPPDPAGRTVVATCCTVAEEIALCRASMRLLPADEQARAARFKFDKDRCLYVAAHLLLRHCLQQATGRADWPFQQNAFGKPALATPVGTPALTFNLTHTKGLVACALTHGHELGIDAEALDRQSNHLDLARRYFAPDEILDLMQSPPHEHSGRFLAIWTAKEAVIKAAGRGLQMPLDSFSVDIARSQINFHDGSGEDGAQWLLHRRQLPGHQVALAVRSGVGVALPEQIDWHQASWADLLNA